MIWGKSFEEARLLEEQAGVPHQIFCWWPRQLESGRYVWLTTIWRRRKWIRMFEYSSYGYVYGLLRAHIESNAHG